MPMFRPASTGLDHASQTTNALSRPVEAGRNVGIRLEMSLYSRSELYNRKCNSRPLWARWPSGLEHWTGDRVVLGSNPAAATSLQNFGNSVYPALPVSFGGDTKRCQAPSIWYLCQGR